MASRRGLKLGYWLRRVLLVLLALVVLPYFLILVYAVPTVHPMSTLMLTDFVTFQNYDRRWTNFDDISPNVVQAVMMSEDGQFCNHDGVDWGEMKGVVEEALAGEATRGASTIPMQTVKNLYLWNSRSFVRKAFEIPLAITSDFVWSKRRIMEIYLNIAEWGPGIYGIEAAAQYHFKVSASKLSRRQAALLAVSLPNPMERNASKPTKALNRLAARVERLARNSGAYITCLYD
ncbi:monofunctional biosynthetic peptidoglycan transglycosylase [Agrobacterium sp. ES01]|uniref:monofunctional biosynthetic peptidoglycan transglycosylase n=1 Tax=Agrobacterium sp. ES01 TaxID=3420714 RepID=UPI003D0B6E7A